LEGRAGAPPPPQSPPNRVRNLCTSFLKRHSKPTKAQLAAANKVLKNHGCTIKA
jgi:hypothetical protein